MKLRFVMMLAALALVGAVGGVVAIGERGAKAQAAGRRLSFGGAWGPYSGAYLAVNAAGGATLRMATQSGADTLLCTMNTASATDAAALLERIEDPKTTVISCNGSATSTAKRGTGTTYNVVATSIGVDVTP